jgi:outer membrane protein assembly factor BamA
LFLLGGLESIRGFDDRSIAASAYSLQKIEYRYLFDDASNLFLFFDGMIYNQKLPDGHKSDKPFGFGGDSPSIPGQASFPSAMRWENNLAIPSPFARPGCIWE